MISNRTLLIVLLLAALPLGGIGYFWMGSAGTTARGSLRVLDHGFVVELSSVHSTDAGGTVTFRPASDRVEILVELEDLRPEAQYSVHLHEGSCSRGGAGGVGLKPVQSDSNGIGSSRKTIVYDRLDGDREYMVMVHRPNQHHALCGDAPSVQQLKTFQ
jgi:hypothetical protein